MLHIRAVIPALRDLRQEDAHKFGGSLGYEALKKNTVSYKTNKNVLFSHCSYLWYVFLPSTVFQKAWAWASSERPTVNSALRFRSPATPLKR